jgi:hypothetical protein
MATMKLRNRGIIRIKTPAIRAMIGEMCAAVIVIEISGMMGAGNRIEGGNLAAGAAGE